MRGLRPWLVAVICVLGCAGLGPGAVAAAPTAIAPAGDAPGIGYNVPRADPPPVAGQTTRSIELTQQFRLTPDRPGEIAVQHQYVVPANVVELEVRLPSDATVTERTGFVRGGGATYEWDGATARPTLTYRLPVDRRADRDDPIAGPGEYLFVDPGPWALATRPRPGHSWGWTGGGEVRLDQRATVDGAGAVSDVIAFLGLHDEYRHTAHGQTYRLIVPAAADLEVAPAELFAALEHASASLRIGDRDPTVFIVAAPTGDVEWGVRGLHTGPADMWVRDQEPLDDVDNVWLHEYVHTRQAFDADETARWVTEGTAVFYAALLTLEQDRIGYDRFARRLARGTSREFDGVRLAEPATWRGHPDYHVAPLVAGELDRQLRLLTDRERSLQDVLRRMNGHEGTVDADRFEQFLAVDGGEEVARLGGRYTRTADRPAVWDAGVHGGAFGSRPALITYAFAAADEADGIRVTGPYREATIGGSPPIDVVRNETLAVPVTVRNDGGAVGTYDARFGVDGEITDRRTGRLAPDETTTLSFTTAFTAPGDHTLSVGSVSLAVRVHKPARASVAAFAANRTTVAPGEAVRLTVTVHNPAALPGELEVPLTLDGRVLARDHVQLAAGEERTVTLDRTFEAPGEYVVGLGDVADERIVITVRSPPTPTTEIGSDLPGFGPAAAALAVVVAAALAGRYRG